MPEVSKPLLHVDALAGGYEPVQVFRQVSFSVGAGASLGLFGPNGHGKSTLLKTLSGLIDPWQGHIEFDGERLNRAQTRVSRVSMNLNYDAIRRRTMVAHEIAQRGLIHVAQGSVLYPELTVEETLDVASATAAARLETTHRREQALTLFPRLAQRLGSKARFLSGGERQMLSISCGLIAAPKLLMLDEPTLGLSPRLRLEIAEAISQIRRGGIAMIIVDQDIEFLRGLIDSLYLFDHGTISARLDHADIPDHHGVMRLLFGETTS